ncbi:pyridoxal phosphate-dependent aminotransferase [Anaerorhabdus sp.]|nr:pyridoxal phosphate-dependent aminotransferase [Anaerorhabdus sp.]MEA4874537.1 pyridoxal phosphate-dependent aminotransferase [Anaerorhabdus sp.]
MNVFNHSKVNLDVLKKKAFNYRWAEVEDGIIPLTAADPDFPIAKEIQDDLIQYIQDGYLSYTPKLGLPGVCEAISKALKERKNETISPSAILPIDSAARAMFVTTQTLLNEGDEAIVFDPQDYLFKDAILSAKATPVFVPMKFDGTNIDLSHVESYITSKTKILTLCNPHNPLGYMYTKKDLEFLLALAKKYDLWIMNDEIWSDIVYPEKQFQSILNLDTEMDQKIVSVYGFSKAFGIAGLRAGILYTHNEEVFQKCIDNSFVMSTAGGITSLSQIAMQTCVEKCYYWTDEFVDYLKTNRDYALTRIAKMPLIHCHKPEATYLLFPNISETKMSSEEFVDYLKDHAKLALVPGTVKFFGPGAEGHVRICFSTSFEILKEGLDRLEMALNDLVKQHG